MKNKLGTIKQCWYCRQYEMPDGHTINVHPTQHRLVHNLYNVVLYSCDCDKTEFIKKHKNLEGVLK